jgi:hypothetical protein
MSFDRERISPIEIDNDVQQQLDSSITQHGNSSIAGVIGNALIGAEIQATGPIVPPSQTEMQTQQTLHEMRAAFQERSEKRERLDRQDRLEQRDAIIQHQHMQSLLQQMAIMGLPAQKPERPGQTTGPIGGLEDERPGQTTGPVGGLEDVRPGQTTGPVGDVEDEGPGQSSGPAGDQGSDSDSDNEVSGDSSEPVGYNDNVPEVPDSPDVREVAARVNDALSQGDIATAASVLGAVTSNMDIVAAQEYIDRLGLKGNVQIQSNSNSLFLTTGGLHQPEILDRAAAGRQMEGISYIGTYTNPIPIAESH